MPRFYFHLCNSEKRLVDCIGRTLDDRETARLEARLTVRNFITPSTGRVHPEWEGWSIQVCDERGRCVASLDFCNANAMDDEIAPAGSRHRPEVVNLQAERTRREIASVDNGIRRTLRTIAALVDRTRYETKSLQGIMRDAEEARRHSQLLLERSRAQTAAGAPMAPLRSA